MGKAGCSVKLKKFAPDLVGYTKVKSAPPAQEILAGKARAVKASADSMSKGSHKVEQRRGKFDMGYVVSASDFNSRYDQAKRKILTKACNSIGGGS